MTLFPKLCLTVWGIISDLIPLLVCTTSTLVVLVLPDCVVLGLPDHWSCQLFHSVLNGIRVVPALNPLSLTKLSNEPLTLAIKSGATSVSLHSSTGGSNSAVPIQSNTKNGLRFSVAVAYGCSK